MENPNAKYEHGYFIVIHNNNNIFGNFEYNGYKFTIRQTDFGEQLIKQWNVNYISEHYNKTDDGPWYLRRHTPPPNTVDGLPWYYETIQWIYNEKINDDNYKYLLMRGLRYPQYQDVSVKFLFSHEVFRGAGIHSRFGPQLIAAYHLKVYSKHKKCIRSENYS